MEVIGSPFVLTTHVTELEGSLRDTENRYKATCDSIEEKSRQVENCRKYAETLKALRDNVTDLELRFMILFERLYRMYSESENELWIMRGIFFRTQ